MPPRGRGGKRVAPKGRLSADLQSGGDERQMLSQRVQQAVRSGMRSAGRARSLGGSADPEQLQQQAQEATQIGDFRAAARAYRALIQAQPTQTRWLDALAEVYLEVGRVPQAKDLLDQSIQMAPTDNFAKYMYAGQLCEGHEAVEMYKKGVVLMEQELARLQGGESDENTDVTGLRRTLSSALCAVADVYMTDLCDDPNAETEASGAAMRAVEIDPTNPDAGQTLASVRISQSNPEAALDALLKSIQIWRSLEIEEPEVQESATGELEEGQNEFDDEIADPERNAVLPSIPSRINSAKLLMELTQYPLAIDIMDDILEQDDMIPDVWHLIGVSYRLSGDLESSASHLLTAIDVLTKLQQSDPEEEDQELIEQIQAELAEIPQSIVSAAIAYETGAILPKGSLDDDEEIEN